LQGNRPKKFRKSFTTSQFQAVPPFFSTLFVVQSVKEFTLRISIQACMYEQLHFVFFKAVDPRLWSSASFVISVIIPPMPFASIIRSATTRACLWGFSYLS
jgi:hypothetical protein